MAASRAARVAATLRWIRLLLERRKCAAVFLDVLEQ